MESKSFELKVEVPLEFVSNGIKEEVTSATEQATSEETMLEPQRDCVYEVEVHKQTIENWHALSWTCHYCSHGFRNYKNLMSHVFKAHDITNTEDCYHYCNDCKKSFVGYTLFVNHIRHVHHENLRLCCDVCNELLPNYKKLSVHRDKHNELLSEVYPVVYHCTLCEKVHSTEKKLKTHIQQMHKIKDEDFKTHCDEGNQETLQNSFKTEQAEAPLASVHCEEEFHETEPIFQCGKCVKSFTSENELQVHFKAHNEDLSYEFEEENTKTPQQQSCSEEEYDETEDMYQCKKCVKSYTNEIELKRHMRVHNNKRSFECEICSKKFLFQSNLTIHLRIHTGERPFQCDVCQKNFNSQGSLSIHVRTHSDERPFQCELCEKRFKSNKDIKEHMRLHTGDFPFRCEICSKRYPRKAMLNYHMRVHTGELPYECDFCEQRFRVKEHRAAHLLKHTGERPFKCDICSESFSKRHQLTFHKDEHAEKSKFQCEICSKKFTCKSNLKIHSRIHTGERPFQCKVCPKSFNSQGSLSAHVRIHSDERPFQCEFCEKRFKINNHKKRHTKICKALPHANSFEDSKNILIS